MKKRKRKHKPVTGEVPIEGGPLIAIDNPWKSLDRYQDPHCHTWQRGTHIDSLPIEQTSVARRGGLRSKT